MSELVNIGLGTILGALSALGIIKLWEWADAGDEHDGGKMSKPEQIKIAERYVDEQLKTIDAYRAAKKSQISPEKYQQVVEKVAEAILCK